MRSWIGIALLACASIAFGQAAKTARKPSPPLASLPAPKASGAMRILLVVDDWERSKGSPIYRKLVADAVGGDAKAWSSVVVAQNQHGPALEKLRDFNVVLWYTGDSYGGAYNGISTLSDEDEKTVRRYLQETGGAFILVSPGFLSTRSYGTSWTESENPFLREVVGINGFAELVQRFTAGTVRSSSGASFTVPAKGSVETQFTAVNPNGAAAVFSATLDPKKTAEGPVPVAVANAYGGGRFVYVGFSLENIAEAERAKAFGVVLEAARGAPTAVVAVPPPTRTPVSQQPPAVGTQSLKPAPPGPAVTNLQVAGQSPADHRLVWQYTHTSASATDWPTSLEIYRRDPDGWKHLASIGRSTGKAHYQSYSDISFVAPNSAYRVATVFADGRRGETEVEYPNPPQPTTRVTGLVASQHRWNGIRLQWDRFPRERGYRVYGPGLPANGVKVQSLNDADRVMALERYQLPPGDHEFRVHIDYTPIPLDSASTYQHPDRVSPLFVPVTARMTAQPPPVVTDLRVEQRGYRRIVLSWKPAANPSGGFLRVTNPTMPMGGRQAVSRSGNDQWMEFREVPEGTHTIRMTYHFMEGGASSVPAPVYAEVTTTVVHMAQTSNDISSCAGTWVSEVCAPDYSGSSQKKDSVGKGGGWGGKPGKK